MPTLIFTDVSWMTYVVRMNNIITREVRLPNLEAAVQAALEPDPAPLPRYDPEPEFPSPFSDENPLWHVSGGFSPRTYQGTHGSKKAVQASTIGIAQLQFGANPTPRPEPARINPQQERPPPETNVSPAKALM